MSATVRRRRAAPRDVVFGRLYSSGEIADHANTSAGFNLGLAFRVLQDGVSVIGVQYLRAGTGPALAQIARLYDDPGFGVLASLTTPAQPGGAWYEQMFSAPVPVTKDGVYVIAMSFPSGMHNPITNNSQPLRSAGGLAQTVPSPWGRWAGSVGGDPSQTAPDDLFVGPIVQQTTTPEPEPEPEPTPLPPLPDLVSSSLLDRLLTVPCQLVSRTYPETADDQGEQTPVVETVQQTTRCELQLAGAREEHGGAVQITTYRVFLPADARARGWDAVRLGDGTVLELEGDAVRARSPLTGIAYVEATVRRTDMGEGEP